jgi:cyclopropane-fatty-acyl-phospholipid synthase
MSNARLNISAHYDISNDMFAAFLSDNMTYSCPIWRPVSDKVGYKETLQQAQMRKLLGNRTGWGSF